MVAFCARVLRLPGRQALGILAGLAVGLWAGAAHALPMGLAPAYEEIVSQFEDVAFGHEHGISQNVVQKWTDTPSYALYTVPDYDIRRYLDPIAAHFRAIQALTGITVTPASKPERATLRMGFYPRADFVKMPGRKDDPEFQRWVNTSACITLAVADAKEAGRIAAGAIAIGIDIPESQRDHCILEEIVQVLGLPNDACHYRPSLFCEDDRVFALTRADQILLRTLYDRRLTPGMARDEARPIFREIIGELMASLETSD